MDTIVPIFTLVITTVFGLILIKNLSLEIQKFSAVFFAVALGIIIFTALAYFNCLFFSFPNGLILAHIEISIFILLYFVIIKPKIQILEYMAALRQTKLLIVALFIIGILLIILFNTHIIPDINGDLYTGESTYGDLPFHLSSISSIAYAQNFPPQNPFYSGRQLAYPYFINFFSAILVYEGLSPRLSIIIPGILLGLSVFVLIYDLAFILTRSIIKSILSAIFYFFNGGLGFYFFLKDYSFNITNIFNALLNPTALKEYSHLFEQNIQWGNFLSRMIVPERALLFGLPAGIILLRILFFRGNSSLPSRFEIILAAFLISLMPLLHTHSVLAFAVILPILGLISLKNNFKERLINYLLIVVLTLIFALPHMPLFLNHIVNSESFFRFHIGWMKQPSESFLWFWIKNSYLFIPLSLIALFIPKLVANQIKYLLVCAFSLFTVINLFLLSPYDWDNVKFLFWIDMFFSIASGAVLGTFIQSKFFTIQMFSIILSVTMVLSALLSIYREINVKYVLFSKEAVSVGEYLKENTGKDSIFLTYKIHNSPVNNIAGRLILMGYPGLLWTQGINYQEREGDVNRMLQGQGGLDLFNKYKVNYVVLESNDLEGIKIDRNYFNRFPIILKTQNYTVYKIN